MRRKSAYRNAIGRPASSTRATRITFVAITGKCPVLCRAGRGGKGRRPDGDRYQAVRQLGRALGRSPMSWPEPGTHRGDLLARARGRRRRAACYTGSSSRGPAPSSERSSRGFLSRHALIERQPQPMQPSSWSRRRVRRVIRSSSRARLVQRLHLLRIQLRDRGTGTARWRTDARSVGQIRIEILEPILRLLLLRRPRGALCCLTQRDDLADQVARQRHHLGRTKWSTSLDEPARRRGRGTIVPLSTRHAGESRRTPDGRQPILTV